WTAAAYLRRMLRRVGWTVTVVGPVPPAGPPIGLATRPILTRFLRGLGIDEAIFMRRCAATYRVASRFDDWFEVGQGHWHPFGPCGPRVNGRDLFHYWLKHRHEGGSGGAYADYSPQALMAATGRGPRPETGISSTVEAGSYGYHLDRTALIRFLREIALSEGVRAVPARVLGASRDFSGNIRALDLEGGGSVEGDVFLDCTGAAALLIGGTLGEAWIAGDAACNSLVSLSLPPARDPSPFTTYVGRPEGWTVSLSLAGRTEAMLAYDGNATTPEAAHAALTAAIGPGESIVHRSLRSGRRNPWLRNVVALGAAARAVEPLAGFGLDLDLVALEAFVEHLPRGEGAEILRRSYIARMNRLHDDALEALAAHYVLGR
ncbi:tryptophan 7-halogenase, partial [Methylobacterium haplocladii]